MGRTIAAKALNVALEVKSVQPQDMTSMVGTWCVCVGGQAGERV